jgi:sugar lactone lactonase YvrE
MQPVKFSPYQSARPSSARRAAALAGLLALAAQPLVASAAIGDSTTDAIVGQPNAVSSTPNVTGVNAEGLNQAYGSAFDSAGNLFVADTLNNRVLGYLSPMTTDHIADLVIGQPDFNSNVANNGGVSASSLQLPIGLAVDATGNLFVADYGNNRVLQYNRPFATDTTADRFIGQPDFTSNAFNNGGLSATSLSFPSGVALDSAGNLWVADYSNNRVLEYNNPIATGDRTADLVLGQPNLTSNIPNNGGRSATSLSGPFGIAVDAHRNVWVADAGNNRALEYDDPKTLGTTADRILGQPSFASGVANYTGGIDAAGLAAPFGIATDINGNAYVADYANSRVLVYTSPIATSDRIADRVHGQPDFNSGTFNNGGISAQTLAGPFGVAIDPTGNVAIADLVNNRLVMLETPAPLVTSLQVKVSPTTGKAKLIVRGFGMVNASAVVKVDGVTLGTTKYKDLAADGSARRIIASDALFDTLVPPGVPVIITVVNPVTGSVSAPIAFTR